MSNLKFMVDHSLARLARWLRLLGYDTVVFQREAGRDMLRLAEAGNRVVLTRRSDMIQRQFSGRLFLIRDIRPADQLAAVAEAFSLKAEQERMFTICLLCNEKLLPSSPQEVRDLVPPYVLENCARFHQCPRCRRVYWMGTHPQNALKFIERHIPIRPL